MKSLHRSVRALRKKPPVKAVRGTLLHMMRHWQYWHFGVTWTMWRLAYHYEWYDSPFWQVQLGPLWIILH